MNDIHVEMFKMWRISWENYVKSLSMSMEQGEKMLDMIFTQSNQIKGEFKNILKEGVSNTKEAQKVYFQTVDDLISKIEGYFDSAN